MDEWKDFPNWAKWIGATGSAIVAAWLYFRQYLSSAKVDRVADDANIATILRLQDQLKTERERADALMRDRESMVAELGQLRGEVKALRDQVAMLTDSVHELRGAKA